MLERAAPPSHQKDPVIVWAFNWDSPSVGGFQTLPPGRKLWDGQILCLSSSMGMPQEHLGAGKMLLGKACVTYLAELAAT